MSHKLRLLVAIASYGSKNDAYLNRMITEFKSMSFDVDIVVLSNASKVVAGNAEVVVGVPIANPWSLPFAHQQIFADRAAQYDLFIYSEDDILITERNIRAFLEITQVLPFNEIAGFMRSEMDSAGRIYFCDVHGPFHWTSDSTRLRGKWTFASFTNEHAACYIATRDQLRQAIASGGFLVEPHEGRYDMLCSAATDVYTQCGLQKVLCLSRIEDFIVPHLSNRYAGHLGPDQSVFERQVQKLLGLCADSRKPLSLFNTETRLPYLRYSKSYYEPACADLLSIIPESAKTILSLGCGWGAQEELLARQGKTVTAIPLDPVIGTCVEARGVRTLYGGLETLRSQLGAQRFDCLYLSNIMHLMERPHEVLAACADLVTDDGIIVIRSPNLSELPVLWKRLRRDWRVRGLGDYHHSGVHLVSPATLTRWIKKGGLSVQRFFGQVPGRLRIIDLLTARLFRTSLWPEIICVAVKSGNNN